MHGGDYMLCVDLYMGIDNLLLNCVKMLIHCFYVRLCLVCFKRKGKPKNYTAT